MVSWPIPRGKSGCGSASDDGEKAAQVSATRIWARFQKKTVRRVALLARAHICDRWKERGTRGMRYTDFGVPRTSGRPEMTGTYRSPSARVAMLCHRYRTGAGMPRGILETIRQNPESTPTPPGHSVCCIATGTQQKPTLTAQRVAPTSRMMAMRSCKSGRPSLAWGATRKTCSMRLSGQRSSDA